MTTLPNCRHPTACTAKTATKLCAGCTLSAKWRDPVFKAAHKAGLASRFADPDFRERHRAASSRNISRWRAENPEEAMRVWTENGSRARTPETRQAQSDAKLAWCPREWRRRYRYLVKSKRIPAAEARPMIEAEIEGAKRRELQEARREIARIDAEMRAREAKRRAEV